MDSLNNMAPEKAIHLKIHRQFCKESLRERKPSKGTLPGRQSQVTLRVVERTLC